MADKGWTAHMATAAGTAAGTGAAQLGLGYGLGVVVWPVAATPDDSAWLGSLGWATWITASATVFGAVLASRIGGGPSTGRRRAPWRFALAISAGLGALVAVALIALPARDAVRADAASPHLVAGGYALAGLGIGIFVAYWAVVSRPVAANLITTAVWLWALAITAIVVELTVHRESATYLTSWQFAEVTSGGRYGTIYWPSALLTIAAAALIGLLAATPAARRGDRGVSTATSGAVGPLLVAASFAALAPRLTGALGPLESSYLIAPYAVLAGLGGSALTVAAGQTLAARRARKAATTDPTGTADSMTATGIATVPAASGRTKAPTPTGRAKIPAVAKSTSAPSQPTGAEAKGDPPAGRPDPPAGGTPTAPAGASPSDAAPGRQSSSPSGTASGPAASPRTTAPGETGSSPGSSGAGTTGAAPSGPRPSAAPAPRRTSPGTDPEIAAAARATPGRAKKVSPARKTGSPKETTSTVTPPPTTPTIAQINSKVSEADK